MILHAPLAMLAGLFAVTLMTVTPEGGLTSAPYGITERAADGIVSDAGAAPLPTLVAFAD